MTASPLAAGSESIRVELVDPKAHGQLVRLRLHADAYRMWFFIGLIALGAYSMIRATLQIVR